MKTWGFGVKALKVAGVTVLICGLWFLASFRGPGKSEREAGVNVSPAASGTANSARTKQDSKWAEAYGRLPLSFEENVGQTAREVRYVSHGGGYELFLTAQEAVVALRSKVPHDLSPLHRMAFIQAMRQTRKAGQMTTIRLHLEGANPEPQIAGMDRLSTKVNYFIGSDPKNWHTNVPSYARVKYTGVYPGVDLVFYGNQRRLEYDFVVAPGADLKAIALKVDGARRMRINSRGDLVLSASDGEVELQKPIIYQNVNGERREIAGKYAIAKEHCVRFEVADYDRSAPLILDPVLNYSTYLGGTGTEDQFLAGGIAVDSSGNAFVAGQTTSVDFPAGTNGSVVTPPNPNSGATFVAGLNAAGTQLLYSTYLAGTTTSAGDSALGVAVDPSGKVYVTGLTFAAGFPTKSPFPSVANTTNGTCFVTKLDPGASGNSSLLFSTYLGGTGGEICNAIAADATGNAYVVGETHSTDFPIQNPFQNAALNTSGTAFLSRINTTTATLVYSTYLTGNGANAGNLGFGDVAFGVAADSSNAAYIVGTTSSTNFPIAGNARQSTIPAANTIGAVFVSKIDTTKTGNPSASLIYSTYLAGSVQDEGFAVALGPNNVIYATGTTNSTDFPTTGPNVLPSGAGKAFVSLVDTSQPTAAATLKYSTYLGGTGGDDGFSIKADSSGNAYVTGVTDSMDFPLTPGAFQITRPNTLGDAFVAKINPNGTDQPSNPIGANPILVYSTYFGGSGDGSHADQALGIALDSANPPNVYITGQTASTNFPVQTPLPKGGALQGASDAFVAKLTLIPTLVVSPAPGSTLAFGTVLIGTTSAAQTVTLTNNTNAAIAFTSPVVNGSPAAANTDYAVTNSCSGSIPFGAANTCTVSVTFKPTVVGAETATLQLTDSDSTSPQNILLTGTGANPTPAVMLAPTSLAFGNQQLNTTSTAQIVTLTNTGTGPLTINTISIPAPSDFAETSTGATACPISPATLAAGANCKISVTFTPTALGARAGTLTITDNAAGNPHTVPLTGTGTNTPPDFTITATAPSPSPVKAGSPATFTVTVTPIGGFNSAVTIACVEPAGLNLSTCTPTTSPITPNGAAVSTLVTVTTTAPSLMVPPPSMPTRPLRIWQIVPLLLAMILLFLLPTAKRLRLRLGMAAATLALLALAGCSGPGAPKKPGTTPGTYPLTVTGTAGATVHTVTPTPSVTVN